MLEQVHLNLLQLFFPLGLQNMAQVQLILIGSHLKLVARSLVGKRLILSDISRAMLHRQ